MASALLLGPRARAATYGATLAGMAFLAGAPRGLAGFLLAPTGLGAAGLALVAVGTSVEELGSIRRIRAGVGLRLVGAGLLAAGVAWCALAWGSPSASLHRAGWLLILGGSALVAVVARHDLAVYRDPRHGQRVRVEGLSPEALRLTVQGRPLSLAMSRIKGATLASGHPGRAALIQVEASAPLPREAAGLTWVASTVEGEVFALTEHQAALDASVLVARVGEAAAAAGEGRRYR